MTFAATRSALGAFNRSPLGARELGPPPIEPPAICYSDVIFGQAFFCNQTGVPTEAVFRWTKEDIGGGQWRVRPFVGSMGVYGPGGGCQVLVSGVWNFYYDGIVQATSMTIGAGDIGNPVFDLCSGGTWPPTPPQGPGDTPTTSAPSSVTLLSEPALLTRVTATTGENFDLTVLPGGGVPGFTLVP
jgi:hypothetical protein